jgi:hypothetical protein
MEETEFSSEAMQLVRSMMSEILNKIINNILNKTRADAQLS